MALTIPRQDMAHLRSDSMTSFISGSLSSSHVAKQSSQTLAQAAQISTRSGLPRATNLVVRFTNNVVVILASGVRQRRLLRSAASHALANSAGLVE